MGRDAGILRVMVNTNRPSVERLVKLACAQFGVTWADLRSSSMNADVRAARSLAAWLLRSYTLLSAIETAAEVGYRSHASVLKAETNTPRSHRAAARRELSREGYRLPRKAVRA